MSLKLVYNGVREKVLGQTPEEKGRLRGPVPFPRHASAYYDLPTATEQVQQGLRQTFYVSSDLHAWPAAASQRLLTGEPMSTHSLKFPATGRKRVLWSLPLPLKHIIDVE